MTEQLPPSYWADRCRAELRAARERLTTTTHEPAPSGADEEEAK